jgi:hypothetical protein
MPNDRTAGSDTVDRPHVGWWVSVVGGMVLTGVLAFHPGAYAEWCALVTARIPQGLLRGIFVAALITHLGEGLYAWRLAQRAGLGSSATGWFLQTFTLGFPSLRLLRRRAGRG